jgi:hypothetical protein
VTDTSDPWGPYRATIEGHLDTCADYLSRLRRSLAVVRGRSGQRIEAVADTVARRGEEGRLVPAPPLSGRKAPFHCSTIIHMVTRMGQTGVVVVSGA